MKKTIFFLLIIVTITSFAQPKQKAEKEFVAALNTILKNTKEEHWKYKGTMVIDTVFAISKKGILSVTVRYVDEEGSYVRSRMEAPVNKIKDVAYDLYLILDYKTDEVTLYESEPNSDELVEQNKTNYFHIGVPLGDGYKEQKKLQKLLDKLLKYYRN